jgi:DNA-binding NtrC family response regulator
MERIVLLSDDAWVKRKTLEEAIEWEEELKKELIVPEGNNKNDLKIDIPPEGMSLDESEKTLIKVILENEGWNKSKTCEILKISRPRLDRKILKYNINPSWQN